MVCMHIIYLSVVVDASQAGEGQLEIAVNDGEVPNQVQVLGNGKCTVSFKPESCIPHVVDIKFNRQNINGRCFTFTTILLFIN